MRKTLIVTAVISISTFVAPTASAQVCGDIDNDGLVNIRDLILVWEHIGRGNATPIDTALAEFDNRRGITVGDGVAITKFIFAGSDSLLCGAAGIYTFPLSMSDTLFMPVMVSIPDAVTEVSLPISIALDSATSAIYLPILPDQISNMDHFDVRSGGIAQHISLPSSIIEVIMSDSGQSKNHLADTVTIQLYDINGVSSFTSVDTVVMINYTRTEPGLAIVSPIATDRSNVLRVAIERNGELFSPVIVTRLFQPPPDSLLLSTDSLTFRFTAGKTVSDTFLVDITSNFGSLQFSVTTSDPWIVLPNLPVIEPETPFSLAVTVDSSLVPIGVNSGFIDITPLDPTVIAPQTRIAIKAIANTPALFQTGDVDCNGIVDIADLTMIISHLFINFDPLPICQE